MQSWSKIIVACLILLFSSVYSMAAADELRLQKLEELLEFYIQENKELKQKIKNLEITKDTAINKPENEVADQLNGTTARARCDANIKGCSKEDLCAISTFTSATGKRKWRAGDLKKFADEAKQRGIACGVENAASTKIETNTKPIATTARARCDANIKGCSEQDLCALSTFTSSTGKRQWRAGDLKKFADEAKQRGIACGVESASNTKTETNTKPVATTARARCDANITGCSEGDLCALSTFTSSTGKRQWRAGDLKKFADEAKQRGIACGVHNNNNASKITSGDKSVSNKRTCKTDIKVCTNIEICKQVKFAGESEFKKYTREAQRRGLSCGAPVFGNPENTLVNNYCPNDVTQCDEKSLCDTATWISAGNKKWKVGAYTKFVNEAKRRGLTCGVVTGNSTSKPQTQKVTQPTKSEDEIIAQCAEPWRKHSIQMFDGYPNQRELVEQQMVSHRLVLKNTLREAVEAGHVSRRDRLTACSYNIYFVNKKIGSFPQLLVEDKHLIVIHQVRCKNKNAPNCFYGSHMYVVTVKNQGTNRQRRLCYDVRAKKDASSQCDAFILRRGELSRP